LACESSQNRNERWRPDAAPGRLPGSPVSRLSLQLVMAQHTFESLHRSLKNGELAPVYYFFGSEDVLKDEAVHAILDRALDPSFRDFNYDQRSASQLDPEQLHSLLNTLPMMAERRVVLLREVEAFKRKAKVKAALETYLKKPSPDTLLILLQGAGEPKPDPAFARGTVAIDFTQLSPSLAIRWINHYARQQKVELSSDAASHLFESVGNDLGLLRMELDKITALSVEGPVGADTVAALVGIRRGETLLSWRDLVLKGEPARAVPMIGPVLDQSGMSGVKMVSMLATSLIGLGLARPHYDRGLRDRALQQKILGALFSIRPFGLGDWKVESEKWAKWVPGWPSPRIGAALRAALKADQALKNTRVSDERGLITDLVLQVTEHRWGEAA
jgi:DNA polymerase-3 subunit delta